MKVGDRVKFLSDTGVGYITKIEGQLAYVDIDDGFEIPTLLNELVVVRTEDEQTAVQRMGGRDMKRITKAQMNLTDTKANTLKEPSHRQYGKIAINADEEDDVVFNVFEMKEKYRRELSMRLEMDRIEEARLAEELRKHPVVPQVKEIVEDTIQTTNPSSSPINAKVVEKVALVAQKNASTIEVVDLHAKEILDSTEGMSSGEILNVQIARFTFILDTLLNSKVHGKIVFIHGIGKGKLKYEMQRTLRNKYPQIKPQDASFKEYGYGAIICYY